MYLLVSSLSASAALTSGNLNLGLSTLAFDSFLEDFVVRLIDLEVSASHCYTGCLVTHRTFGLLKLQSKEHMAALRTALLIDLVNHGHLSSSPFFLLLGHPFLCFSQFPFLSVFPEHVSIRLLAVEATACNGLSDSAIAHGTLGVLAFQSKEHMAALRTAHLVDFVVGHRYLLSCPTQKIRVIDVVAKSSKMLCSIR
jgi:hypothetical protein